MFGELWLYITVLLIFVGALLGQGSLVAMGFLFFLTGGIARLWSKYGLLRLEYERTLGETRAFIGETVDLTVRVANRKLLPLPWLELRDEVPENLAIEGGKVGPCHIPSRAYLNKTTSMSWYERVGWRYKVHCAARGYYRFGPVRTRTSDLFGFFPKEGRAGGIDYLLVYPQVVPLTQLGLPSKRPFGEQKGGEPIFENPYRVQGVRDYRPSDPLKRIDWKATARRQSLQVRVYEPTITPYFIVFLNIDTFRHSWEGYNPELLERVISVAASVAKWAQDEQCAVGLYANGSFPESDRPIKILPSRAPEQLTRVLEALAMIVPLTTSTIEGLLQTESHSLPFGATLVVITATMSESLLVTLMRQRELGQKVALLTLSTESLPRELEGITVYRMGRNTEEALT